MHPGIVAHEQSALGIDPLRSPAPLTVGLHDVDLLIQRDALPGVSGVQAAPVRITGRLHEPCPPTVQIRHHRRQHPIRIGITAGLRDTDRVRVGSGAREAQIQTDPDNGARLVAHGQDSGQFADAGDHIVGPLDPHVVHTSSADRIGDGDSGQQRDPAPRLDRGTVQTTPPGSLFQRHQQLPVAGNAHQVRVRRPGTLDNLRHRPADSGTNVGHRGV